MGQIITLTDYHTECGSVSLSFIQMLAATLAGYHDIAGDLHYRINGASTSSSCTLLDDFLDCDISHIDPERLLVENTFAIDECGRLVWKSISNSDNDWVDYSDCNEGPLTFYQLLARSILMSGTATYINSVVDSGACAAVTALMSCTSNEIESERLLVANAFAFDDCGRTLIKFFSNSSTMTDYHTACVDMPQTFLQMLARCLVLYEGHYYINIAQVIGYCDDLHDFWTCDTSHIDPERALVENAFATDSCGNLALKVFSNSGLTP